MPSTRRANRHRWRRGDRRFLRETYRLEWHQGDVEALPFADATFDVVVSQFGHMFALVSRYMPPSPPGVSPPSQWGSPDIVRERLGGAVTDLMFDRGLMTMANLSPAHVRVFLEQSVGPVMRIVQTLASDATKLADFRRELDALLTSYFDPTQNVLRQDYLLTRAIKAR